jgi:hypothetical protein
MTIKKKITKGLLFHKNSSKSITSKNPFPTTHNPSNLSLILLPQSLLAKYFLILFKHKNMFLSKQEINHSLLDLYNISKPFINFNFHVGDEFFR